MTPTDWAAFSAAVATTATLVFAGIRFLVKHYLSELKTNHGSSLRDAVDRLERRVDELYVLMSGRNNE